MTTEIQIDERVPQFPINYVEVRRPQPRRLIVLMPSAQPAPRNPEDPPRFFRWSWADAWPHDMVIAFADPALQSSLELSGAWFINPQHDFIQIISELVKEKATEHRIKLEDIVFYGSSLGGFGAISAAACLKGAKAVAEVPQIDFRDWIPGPKKLVEKHILGESLDSFYDKFPERINVMERIHKSMHVPEILIITNPTEYCLDQQLKFAAESNALVNGATVKIILTDLAKGHAPLERKQVAHLI